MLVKLFGIGIYNALLGNDRSVDNVCKLLNKPRLKKEAKMYYRIDSDDVSYQSENENDVSEVEIQNILAHYKRLGKDEKRYVDSFDNIASQYNDVQLRVISKFLPLNVRAVLEEKSPKYQEIISYNSKVSDNLRSQNVKKEKIEKGTSEKLLNTSNREKILSKPVVIPSSVNMNGIKKMSKIKNQVRPIESVIEEKEEPEIEKIEDEESKIEPIVQEAPKRKRGRPRKNPIPEPSDTVAPKRKRGRPKKNPIPEEKEVLPDLEDEDTDILPGFTFEEKEDVDSPDIMDKDEENTILPGFDQKEDDDDDEFILPGFDEENNKDEQNRNIVEESPIMPGFNNVYEEKSLQNINESYQNVDISNILTSDKKIACFIGTSKNGTSFIVNNLAEITAGMGIDTAILDTTKNRNSYYIYTKNEEALRKTAMESISNLLEGTAKGIQAGKNLTVYTSLPEESEGIENAGAILQTLLKKHSLVLIDCDFDTPIEYFEKVQEIYLVQSFDILTIQPLTAFLRELKSKNVLKENKLRAVLNKAVKIRGINDKTIIGGMAYYNDPAMSFMTELFDKNTIRYITVPFNEDVYTKYLENVINCEVSVKGYPKNIVQILNELANMVYPLVSGKSAYMPPKLERNGFTPSMNSTLNQMKNRY